MAYKRRFWDTGFGLTIGVLGCIAAFLVGLWLFFAFFGWGIGLFFGFIAQAFCFAVNFC